MKKCPACAEEIKDEARICRYCGTVVATGWRGFLMNNSGLVAFISLAVLLYFFWDEYFYLVSIFVDLFMDKVWQ